MDMVRIRPPKVAQVISEQIERDIVAGKIPVGGALAHERELMRHYDVSRAAIREALRILESDGFVVVRPGRRGGATVCRPEPERFTSTLASMLQFRRARLRSLLEVRLVLEPVCARLAALHLSPEHEPQLREMAATLMARAEDPRLFDDDNATLHGLIGAASANPLLDVFSTSLRNLIYQCTASISFPVEIRRQNTQGHLRIVDAVLARDAERAERRMRRHIEAFDRYLADVLPAGADAVVECGIGIKRMETPPILRDGHRRSDGHRQ